MRRGLLLLLCGASAAAALAPLAAWRAAHRVAPLELLRDPPTGCPVVPSTVPLPPGPPWPAPLAAALDALADLLRASVNATSVPAAALEVSYRGTLLANFSFGVTNKEGRQAPSTSETLWRIGSVSKVFPALALHILADDGGGLRRPLVRLDDAVADFAPAFAPLNPFDDSRPTFRHLASQRSGLQREAPYGANSTAAALAALSQTLLVQPPGGRPSYSNLGFAVLAHVLAEFVAAPATDVAGLMQAEILGPLAMTSTGFDYSAPNVMQRLATGYDADGNAVPFANLGWWFPAGSMYASLADLSLLAFALLSGGNSGLALSAAGTRALFDPGFFNRDGESLFGGPWETLVVSNVTTDGARLLALSKGGNLPGYSTLLVLVPELQVSLVAAWSGGADEIDFGGAALAALLPPLAAALAALAPVPPYDPSPHPGDYTGTYLLEGTEVLVRLQGGLLLWFNSALNLQVALDYAAPDVFRVAFPDAAFTCLLGELEALRFQYVHFSRSEVGVVVSTSLPGWVPGAEWRRG